MTLEQSEFAENDVILHRDSEYKHYNDYQDETDSIDDDSDAVDVLLFGERCECPGGADSCERKGTGGVFDVELRNHFTHAYCTAGTCEMTDEGEAPLHRHAGAGRLPPQPRGGLLCRPPLRHAQVSLGGVPQGERLRCPLGPLGRFARRRTSGSTATPPSTSPACCATRASR